MQASSLGPQSHKINKELEELTCGPKNWHPACGGTHSVFIGAQRQIDGDQTKNK